MASSWHGRRPPGEDHIVVRAWRERDEARAENARLRKALERNARKAEEWNRERIEAIDHGLYAEEENDRLRAEAESARAEVERLREARRELDGVIVRLSEENQRLRAALLTVVEQVESCCSRSGLCIDVDRVRAEAQRPMDRT